MTFTVVAVHGGAGVHNRKSYPRVKSALKSACSKSFSTIQSDDQSQGHRIALTAVADAISSLEDDDCLNAGFGSNLTFDGHVECDAALMDGSTGDFGSIGAISGVKNPVRVAHTLLMNSNCPDALGRIRPLTLIGDGARAFASSKNLDVVKPEAMISAGSFQSWSKWKDRWINASSAVSTEPTNFNEEVESLHEIQDTVGAVICTDATFAAGVSSGGLLLKDSGRVGEYTEQAAGHRKVYPAVSQVPESTLFAHLWLVRFAKRFSKTKTMIHTKYFVQS